MPGQATQAVTHQELFRRLAWLWAARCACSSRPWFRGRHGSGKGAGGLLGDGPATTVIFSSGRPGSASAPTLEIVMRPGDAARHTQR